MIENYDDLKIKIIDIDLSTFIICKQNPKTRIIKYISSIKFYITYILYFFKTL